MTKMILKKEKGAEREAANTRAMAIWGWGVGAKRAKRKAYGLHEGIAQRVRTEDLIRRRRVLCETLESAVGIFRDETSAL